MANLFGAQSQRFEGVVQAVAQSHCGCWKVISPDSEILKAIKQASPQTTTIVRTYTGQPTVDDAGQHADAEQYGVEYATRVYAAVQDPAHMDFLESENEPNDHYGNLTEFIKRQNAFLVGFARRAKQLGFRPLGPNFSTGYPECYVKGTHYQLWPNAWQGLTDGLRALRDAGGALGLHEYDAPDLFRLWSDTFQRGYLVGRHKSIYACLPADLQSLPLYVTEFGIDFLVSGVEGGFWTNRDEASAPGYMVEQMREAWRRVYSTTPQLKGICFFLWGTTDVHFANYDIVRSDASIQAFKAFFASDLPPGVATPLTGSGDGSTLTGPGTTGGATTTGPGTTAPGSTTTTVAERVNAAWNSTAVAYNPATAFLRKARALGLGRAVGNEYSYTAGNGQIMAGQGFEKAFLECVKGDFAPEYIRAYDWLSGAEIIAH